MIIDKDIILKNICYTDLVYERINKKLRTIFSRNRIESFIMEVLSETTVKQYEKIGKNYYVTNEIYNLSITINSNTFRITTVNKLTK